MSVQDPSRSLRLKAFSSSTSSSTSSCSFSFSDGEGNENEDKAILGAVIETEKEAVAERTGQKTTRPTPTKQLSIDEKIETESMWEQSLWNLRSIVHDKNRVLKIFCDRSDHLSASLLFPNNRIVMVENEKEADVLYLIEHTMTSTGTK